MPSLLTILKRGLASQVTSASVRAGKSPTALPVLREAAVR